MKKIILFLIFNFYFLKIPYSICNSEVSEKTLIIPYIPECKILIDGRLNEKVWKKALFLNNFYLLNKKTKPTQDTGVYIFYTNDGIYFGFKCFEEKIDLLSSFFKKDGGPIWTEDCVEIFLDVNHTHKKYFQFITNITSLKTGYYFLTPKGFSFSVHKGWLAKANKEKGYWISEIKIPFSLLGIRSSYINGSILGINITRQRYVSSPELSSIIPLENSFHQPEKFCHFYLGEKPNFIVKEIKIDKEKREIKICLDGNIENLLFCYSVDKGMKIYKFKITNLEEILPLIFTDFKKISTYFERNSQKYFYKEFDFYDDLVIFDIPDNIANKFQFIVNISELPIPNLKPNFTIFWYIEKIYDGHTIFRYEDEGKLKIGKNLFVVQEEIKKFYSEKCEIVATVCIDGRPFKIYKKSVNVLSN